MVTCPILTLSIVSHGQAALIQPLLDDVSYLPRNSIEVILTINIPEDETAFRNLPLQCRILRNKFPKGFGANHNAAFEQSAGKFFAVVNPDIRMPALDLDALLAPMRDPAVGAVAPVVKRQTGAVEDSVRRFPTVSGLVRRVLLKQRMPGYQWNKDPIDVDWAAGMFIVFRREAFSTVGGFDHRRFFMYFEDVDICARLWQCGWSVVLQPQVAVIHDARRASHRSIKHLRWHLISAARYFSGL